MSATSLAVGDHEGRPSKDGLLRDEPLSAPPKAASRRKLALIVGAAVAALAILALAALRPFDRGYTRSQPDWPSIAHGSLYVDGVGESHWRLVDWNWRRDWDMSWIVAEGAPQILFFDDVIYGHRGSEDYITSERPGTYTRGYASRYDANVETLAYVFVAYTAPDLNWTDPRKVSLSVNGSPYDLSEGCLFLIKTADGGASVQQIDADMPAFRRSEDGGVTEAVDDFGELTEAVNEFAASNDDVLAFLKEISENQNRK
jgi:hypothetical protein